MRGVRAGRSAARAPGGAPRSPARHARLHSSLAGKAPLPSPGAFCPGRACAAGGAPHASGALSRPSHNASAMCSALRATRRAPGARRRSGGQAPWLRQAPEESSSAPSARSLKARHAPCVASARGICGSASLRVLDPARGHGPRRARSRALAEACPRGGRARRAGAARRRPSGSDACALPALDLPRPKAATASHVALRGAHACGAWTEHAFARRRTRPSFARRARPFAARARAGRAPHAPGGFT